MPRRAATYSEVENREDNEDTRDTQNKLRPRPVEKIHHGLDRDFGRRGRRMVGVPKSIQTLHDEGTGKIKRVLYQHEVQEHNRGRAT